MSLIIILIANFFVLIISLIGVQSCYFKSKWGWFTLMLICVLSSGACIYIELIQWLTPATQQLPIVIRQPTTPL